MSVPVGTEPLRDGGDTTTDRPHEPSEPSRREVTLATTAITVVVAIYVANAALHGALGASRNDDWAYLRVVFRFADSNEFSLDGWTQMSFIGQALVAWPIVELFGSSIVAMQLLVASMAVVGCLACYLTIRTFASPAVAAGSVAALMIGPVFGALSTSFMTDVPAFCFQMVMLACATRLLRHRWSSGWFVAMCVAGIVATSIREYGLALLAVAIAAVGLHHRPAGRQRVVFVVGAGLSMTVIGLLLSWRAGVPNGDPDGVALTWDLGRDHVVDGVRATARALLTLGVLVAPVAALAVSRRVGHAVRRAPWRSTSIVVIWIAVGVWSGRQWLGNYVTAAGSYRPLIEGPTPPVFNPAVDAIVRWVGYVSLLGLLLLIGLDSDGSSDATRRWPSATWFRTRSPLAAARNLVVMSVFGLAAVHAVLTLTSNTPFFDRYLIVFVPLLIALAATSSLVVDETIGVSSGVLGIVLCAGLGLIGVALVDASATIDGAKWRFGERLESAGFEARSIDAGFEWFNFHQRGVARQEPGPDRNWWTSFYADTPVCVTAVAGGHGGAGGEPVVATFVARSALGERYVFDAVVGPSRC